MKRLLRLICYLEKVKFYEHNVNDSCSCTGLKSHHSENDCV